MRKNIRIFLIFFILSQNYLVFSNHSIKTEISMNYFSYNEKSEESGVLPGLALEYSYYDSFLFKVLFDYSYTKVDFSGESFYPKPNDKSAYVFANWEFALGYSLFQKPLNVTPVLSLGYLSFQRDVGELYSENYVSRELNFGLNISYKIKNLTFTSDLFLKYCFDGLVHINLHGKNSRYNSPEAKLSTKKLGFLGKLSLFYRLNQYITFFSLWYEKYYLGNSNNLNVTWDIAPHSTFTKDNIYLSFIGGSIGLKFNL